ncbi:hypothetical protein M2266_003133 [Streptomyces sp. SPB162]|nr:hypothetical protein [Streptomyces sp. SPB162]
MRAQAADVDLLGLVVLGEVDDFGLLRQPRLVLRVRLLADDVREVLVRAAGLLGAEEVESAERPARRSAPRCGCA